MRVRTGARLHFGMLAYGGESQRQFGGVGLMIDAPNLRIEIDLRIRRDRTSASQKASTDSRISGLLQTLADGFSLPGLELAGGENQRLLPQHTGLGSGTQLAAAIAAAGARLAGEPADAERIAEWSGRGMRSGIGLHGFLRGGLIVDGGKGASTRLAPLAARHPFPLDWPVLLLMPRVPVGLHGDAERRAFAERVKFSPATVESLSRLALLGVLPGVAERDYAAFGEAVYELNLRVGECFAGAQGGVYAHPQIERLAASLRRAGLRAVGQSSWGPTVFAVAPDPDAAEHAAAAAREEFPDVAVMWARARNRGADLIDAHFVPRLLVSVRSMEEADAALAAGADVIDVKEPKRGPLGAADLAEIRAIRALVHARSPDTPVTAALGELREAERTVDKWRSLPSELMLLKVGLAGERGRADWKVRFLKLAQALRTVGPLIPAIYRDASTADAPEPLSVVSSAAKAGAPFLLFDTFDKTKTVPDDQSECDAAMNAARAWGIQVACAGSLRAEDLAPLLANFSGRPDVVAIRGAACEGGRRDAAVSSAAVAEFRRALWRAAAPVRAP